MSVIEVRNLTKYYGKNRGIVNLTLSVAEGDMFGFIGPNGSGKSTTIRSLLGLIYPTSGSATILGYDCLKSKEKILENVGYIPSESMFYSGMRVSEIISYSAKLRKKDCSQEAKHLCDRLQLDTKKKMDELSLGNRKKVSIVCALQHMPKLYILDEPTSGLDPLMQREFFTLLEERRAQGATIFLSSHTLSEIQRHCNNAAIIREGTLIVSDTVEALSKTTARRVVVHGVSQVPELKGVLDVNSNSTSISFLYGGTMKDLISSLNGLPITDLVISEPDLEEIFMHFYTEGGRENDSM